MLGWYFKSMLIWTLIFTSLLFCLWAYKIVSFDDYPKERRFPVLFVTAVIIAAVPVFRFLFAVGACIKLSEKMFRETLREEISNENSQKRH